MQIVFRLMLKIKSKRSLLGKVMQPHKNLVKIASEEGLTPST